MLCLLVGLAACSGGKNSAGVEDEITYTYLNTDWGFSFKYPPSYQLLTYAERTDLLVLVSDSETKELGQAHAPHGLSVFVKKQPFEVSGKIYPTIEEFAKNYFKTDSLKTVYLGSDKFIEVAMVNIEMVPLGRSLHAIKGDYLFTISVSLDENSTKIANSFRFTR